MHDSEHAHAVAPRQILLLRWRGALSAVRGFVERHILAAAPPPLIPGAARISHDREKPGFCITTAPFIKKPERPQIRFLHHILRIGIAVREPAGQIVRRVHVRKKNLFEAVQPRIRGRRIVLAPESQIR